MSQRHFQEELDSSSRNSSAWPASPRQVVDLAIQALLERSREKAESVIARRQRDR
jgi:hypothetical protein